jgi:hypothetical protein
MGEINTNGILSGPLSAVTSVTEAVEEMGGSSLPVVGTFLSPFNAAARKTVDFLKWLGYSSPNLLDMSATYRYHTSMRALVNGRDSSLLLRNDVQNGLAIDAKAATVGSDDDMLISSIITKPGYVETMFWSPSLGLGEQYPVTPKLCFQISLDDFRLTPLAHVALAHFYWSGPIVYTVEIVASAFHRGTIGISYVPYNSVIPINYLDYPNRFKTTIMDITQTKLIDFEVPFAASTQNLRVGSLNGPNTDIFTNGSIAIYQINPLKSAGSTSDVAINLYIKGTKDTVFYRPTTAIMNQCIFVESNERPVPESEGIMQPMIAHGLKQDRSMIYFGEQSKSIKEMCNKPAFAASARFTNNGTGTAWFVVLPIWAVPRLQDLNRHWTYAAWFQSSFLAMRGGIRHKIQVIWNSNNANAAIVDPSATTMWFLVRDAQGFAFVPYGTSAISAPSGLKDFLTGANSAVPARVFDHPLVEVEVPYIGMTRFYNPRQDFNRHRDGETVECWTTHVGADDVDDQYIFTSSADDFSLHQYFIPPKVRINGGGDSLNAGILKTEAFERPWDVELQSIFLHLMNELEEEEEDVATTEEIPASDIESVQTYGDFADPGEYIYFHNAEIPILGHTDLNPMTDLRLIVALLDRGIAINFSHDHPYYSQQVSEFLGYPAISNRARNVLNSDDYLVSLSSDTGRVSRAGTDRINFDEFLSGSSGFS